MDFESDDRFVFRGAEPSAGERFGRFGDNGGVLCVWANSRVALLSLVTEDARGGGPGLTGRAVGDVFGDSDLIRRSLLDDDATLMGCLVNRSGVAKSSWSNPPTSVFVLDLIVSSNPDDDATCFSCCSNWSREVQGAS